MVNKIPISRKSKLPEWIGQETSSKICLILRDNPLPFEKLLRQSEVSRATLSIHLKKLIIDKRVEKIIKENQPMYIANEANIGKAINTYLEPLKELSSILEKQKGQFYTHLILHFIPEYLAFVVKFKHTDMEEIREFINDWFSQKEES